MLCFVILHSGSFRCCKLTSFVPVHRATILSPKRRKIGEKLRVFCQMVNKPKLSGFVALALASILSTSSTLCLFKALAYPESTQALLVGRTDNASNNELQLLSEIWSLVDNYYYDKTYSGHSWNQIWKEYSAKLTSRRETTYKVATEMVKVLKDPYSAVVRPADFQRLLKYDMTGTGLLLAPSKDGNLLVTGPPPKGSPAQKAGIRVGDRIVAVNGKPVKGMTSIEAAEALQGDGKSQLVLILDSEGTNNSSRTVTLNREYSKENAIPSYRIFPFQAKDREYRVGYIKIREFNASVAHQLLQVVNYLEHEGANAYILDLQGNRGGALEGAVQVASIFMDHGTVVRIIDRNHHEDQLTVDSTSRLMADNVTPTTDPLVILTDKYSASASEILASALHDNCRAVLVGQRTFGKGLVQAVFGLSDGGGLVLTVAEYQTPNHLNIHKKGIEPDIFLKQTKPSNVVRQWDNIHRRLCECRQSLPSN
ncbi:hypothetical protein GAYE_PCTG14G0627 [Galdieria yellowstonensis]|uniref:PDZ domain-containing protein n=1 Tax=Galdieria yellowstonensis TaxID=3028027 RepID=A0AAV9I3Q8_9RHOD|nr:hypothetical protein GAYE_PCTG14G0627 [Galdieria yellowstonensis]